MIYFHLQNEFMRGRDRIIMSQRNENGNLLQQDSSHIVEKY